MKHPGLTTSQVQESLNKFGSNILPAKNRISALALLFSQFRSFLVVILLAAALVSFISGDQLDSLLILTILIFNALLGFYQEYKASKEVEALRKLEVSNIRVIRDGVENVISAQYLVPGDLVKIESGDKIPADSKVLESFDLYVNEAALTGESLPLLKTIKDQENQLFLGSVVTSGRALIEITSTGGSTRLGALALKLSDIEDEKTPMEKSVSVMAQLLAVCAIAISGIILALHIYSHHNFLEAFFLATSVAVAAVPEGLPVITTILLSLGARNMYRKQTLVRKMIAIENLGAVNLICTDKTGTITKNEMSVFRVLEVKGKMVDLIDCAVLCSSASLLTGDSTEQALLKWAEDQGVNIEDRRAQGQIIDEEPFNLQTRLMKVVWSQSGKSFEYIKGAPEKIITDDKEWEKKYQQMAAKGLRVLGFMKDGRFLGLIGISDPPREEVKESLLRAQKAGIKTVMVTGDNELTAKFIASEVGLLSNDELVVLGSEIDKLSDEELMSKMDQIAVFARCQPEHKLRIVSLYQRKGSVVAVTGDGVNDALALKKAEVGISMGGIGTEVAKEASDVIILNDDFSSIILAIEEGRVIYSNLSKITKFLITGNLSEVLLILIAGAAFLPSPLLPAQILWINLISDGILALPLAFDHDGSKLMNQSPRKLAIAFFNEKAYLNIALIGLLIAVATLDLYFIGLYFSGIDLARTLAFTGSVIFQIGLMLFIRGKASIFRNKYLIGAILTVITTQALIIFVPELRQLFKLGL